MMIVTEQKSTLDVDTGIAPYTVRDEEGREFTQGKEIKGLKKCRNSK